MEDKVVINNITLKVNPSSIMSRQKRRLVKEEYIRENSVFSHMGKYSDANFTILLQFNMDDEVRKMVSPRALPDMLKLLCQIDNFPFLYIKSKKLESYLTQTAGTNLDQMIFGLESYGIYYTSDTNNILTLKLDIKYFNHVPLTSGLSFYSMTKDPERYSRTRVVNEKSKGGSTITTSGDIRESEVFDRYFHGDYAAMYERVSAYKSARENSKSFSDTKVRYPLFLDDKPENDDYSKMEIKTVDLKNNINSKSVYATWKDSGDISKIGDSNSPINNISITKYNNFASHSMTSWAYPVLQYMGKGMTKLDFSFNENSLSGYSLRYLKTLLSKIDANQLDYYRYSQFNVLKIDNILVDLIPSFGFILDSEFIKSSSDLQGVDQASFSFIAKDIGDLIERKGYNSANTRSTKMSISEMAEAISGVINQKITANCGILNSVNTRASNSNDVNYDLQERLRNSSEHSRKLGKWPDGLNDQYLQGLEDKYQLPRHILYNVMMQESGGKSYHDGVPVTSSSGAEGLFQFMPATAKQYGLTNPHDPQTAADAAARFYRDLLKKYDGNIEFALAAYNSGMGNVDKAISATLAAGGTNNWRDVREHLVTSSSNQEQVIDYVSKITDHISQDLNNIGSARTCYRDNEVNSAKDQVEGVLRKIGQELGVIKKEDLTKEEKRRVAHLQEEELRYLLGDSRSRKLERDFINSHERDISQSKQIEILRKLTSISENKNIKKDDSYYLSVSMLEETVQSLSAQGRAGNAFLSIHMSKFISQISGKYDRLINSFNEEAYYDLQLGKRLGVSNLLSEDSKEVEDPRDINPMFFMESKPYIREDTLESGYNKASSELGKTMSQVSESISKVIKESTSPMPGEYKLPQKPEYSETDKIQEKLRKMTIVKAMKQAGNRLGGKDRRLDSDTISGARGSRGMDMVEQGVGNEDRQAEYFFPRSAQPFDRGINQAFPVIKVYLVEGDEDSIKENISNPKHEFYELTGLVSVKIAHQDEISPVDVALIRISNPGSVYTDQTVYMDMHKPSKNWKAGMDKTPNATNIPLNRLKLRPGNRIHIRGGYSNDINKLETMFNGIVTEVEGESSLYLVCESYGRELISHDHGDDPTEDNWYGGADTLEVISNFLYSGEVEHFGNIKFFSELIDREGKDRRALTLSNIFSYAGSHALFINIYSEEIIGGYDYGFGFWEGLLGNKVIYPKFPIYKITPWEALKEMEYRHPGSLAKPCNYGDRSTFFYGIKEQLYVYRDTSEGIRKGINIGPGKRRRSDKGSLGRSNRLKPVSDFHILASDFNIISNSLRVTNNFDTVVDIAYWTSQSDFKSKDFDWYTMKMDDNIRPMDHRNGRLQMNGINGKYSAFTYGSTYLKKEAEKMYDGKILIIGNQNIKSGDYALLDDASRDLYGIIKIRECIQHFDTENGFITEIRPGLFAESSHTDYSFLFSKLGIGYSRGLSAARSISRHLNRNGELFAKFSLYADIMGLSNSSGTSGGSAETFKKAFTRDGAMIVANQGALAGVTAYSSYRTLKWAKDSSSMLAQGLRIGGQAIQFASGAAVGGAKLAASATGASGYLSSLVARSHLLSTAMPVATGLLRVARAAGPIGWIGTIVGAVVSNYIEEESLTRQPIRMNYLQMGGKPYIGGIVGYHEGSYVEDLVSNVENSLENIRNITTKLGFV